MSRGKIEYVLFDMDGVDPVLLIHFEFLGVLTDLVWMIGLLIDSERIYTEATSDSTPSLILITFEF